MTTTNGQSRYSEAVRGEEEAIPIGDEGSVFPLQVSSVGTGSRTAVETSSGTPSGEEDGGGSQGGDQGWSFPEKPRATWEEAEKLRSHKSEVPLP